MNTKCIMKKSIIAYNDCTRAKLEGQKGSCIMVKGKIGFRIIERKNHIPADILERFSVFSSCNVADAMGRFRVMSAEIKPVVPTRRIVGRAITVLVRGA